MGQEIPLLKGVFFQQFVNTLSLFHGTSNQTQAGNGRKDGSMKKLLVFLALALVAFTACAGGQDAREFEGENIRLIRLWVNKSESDDEGRIYRVLADQFNDAGFMSFDGTHELRVRVEFMGTAETLATAISAEILTGGLPDIIAIDATAFAAYQNEGVIVPIGDYFTEEELASYLYSVIAQSTIEGRLYGLSAMEAPGGMYYNRRLITPDILAAAGLAGFGTIDEPWSWRDVQNVLLAMRAAGRPDQIRLNLGFGGAEGSMYLYSSLVYSAGGQFHVGGNITDGLTSEATLAGLRMLELMFRNVDGANFAYMGTNVDAFPQEEVALQIFGPWDVTNIIRNYPEFMGHFGIMPMPVFEAEDGRRGTIATPSGSWGLSVTRDSRFPEDAARVIGFFTSPDASHMFHQGIGTFPTHRHLFYELPVFTEEGPLRSLAELLTYTAAPRPVLAHYPRLAEAFASILEYIETMSNEPGYDLAAFVQDRARAADAGAR